MRDLLLVSLSLCCFSKAFGQADFTRQVLSSGRYEVKKAAEPARKPAAAETVVATKVETSASAAATTIVVPAPAPVAAAAAPAPVTSVPAEEPGVLEQVQSVLGSKEDGELRRYQDSVDEEDPRLNRLEIEGRAGMTTVGSTSNYSYRDYNTSFATVDLHSRVWLAPSFGLTGSIQFSLGGSLRGDPATGSMDPLKDEEMEVGLQFRRFFGISRQSPSMTFEMLYLDHAFNVSTDSTTHARWRSSGLGLGFRSRLPVSDDRAWTLGGKLYPRLQHRENKTSVAVSSGDPSESVRLDLEIGNELSFGRSQQIVYSLGLSAERNLFDGPASLADPKTGATPSNVTVTNSSANFSFGYRWGR